MVEFDLRDRKILVVGAAAGIGKSTLEVFKRSGASVIGVDIAFDGRYHCDITCREGIAKSVASAADELKGIDGLVVTVGGGDYLRIDDMTFKDWDNQLKINLVGPTMVVTEALPWLRNTNRATVTLVSSAAGLKGSPEHSAYGAAKAGLIRWAAIAAKELANDGIRVNTVSPGPVDTALLHANRPSAYSQESWPVEIGKHTLLGRVGQASEVADAIAFLTSAGSAFITGTNLAVDGGETA